MEKMFLCDEQPLGLAAPLAISDIAMAVVISPLNGLSRFALYFGTMCKKWHLLG